ncbi:class I lanthipeptide [uncultured Aquimarina sp.]|uniref:class I lanthipeptide n=1 Tax=uncultured Aquimarina sp. TaxID=575652 RepID=UPI00344ACA73
MKIKKGKKLSLQKIKIANLNQNSLRYVKGGTGEIPIDFSATQCETDTCTDGYPTYVCDTVDDFTCQNSDDCTGASNNLCRSNRNCTR